MTSSIPKTTFDLIDTNLLEATVGHPISPEKRKKVDNSAEFHRAMRKKREKTPPTSKITPAPEKIGEGRDNLKGRSDRFKNRTGNSKP